MISLKQKSNLSRNLFLHLLTIVGFVGLWMIFATTAWAIDGTGMLNYDEDGANNLSPHYRTWSGTDLSGESNAQDDESASDDTNHTVVEASPNRDEYLMARMEQNGHLDVQVFSGGSWIDGSGAPTNGNFTTGIGTTNDVYRSFDVAYENVTGNGMVLYESTTTGDGLLKYRVWDGTSWSNEQTLDYSAVDEGNASVRWVACESDPGSDYIMCGWRENTNLGVYAAVWDGSSWIDIVQVSAENGTSTRQDFDVAWEGVSGDGMIVFGDSTASPFIDAWTYTKGSGWADTSGMTDPGGAAQWVTIAGSPINDYIAVMINETNSTTSADMNVDMWNGSNWTSAAQPATMDVDINNNGYAQGQDVAWEQSSGDRALFVWRDGTTSELYIRYMVYDISANQFQAIEDGTHCLLTEGGVGTTENITSLAAAEDANGPCSAVGMAWEDSVSGITLVPDPGSNKIMVLGQDQTLDLKPEMQLWNGDANGTWLTQTATMGTYELDLSTGATLSTSLPTKPYDFAFRTSAVHNIWSTGAQTTNLGIGAVNAHIGGSFVINRTTSTANVTSITIAEQGTIDGLNHLDNIKLYYEMDTSAPYNCLSESYAGTETQYGSTDTTGFSAANGISTFTGSVAVTPTSVMCVYVVLDVTSGASAGQTIEIQITTPNTDVVVSAGSLRPGFPVLLAGTTTVQTPITISGTCDGYDQTTDCTDDGSNSIKFALNGVLQAETDSVVDGAWSISGGSMLGWSAGDVITIFVDGVAGNSDKAVAVTKYSGSGDITGVKLFKEHITIGSNQDTSLTNVDLNQYDNSNDTDIIFEAQLASGQACTGNGGTQPGTGFCSDIGSYSSQDRIYIDSGDTWAPGGSAVINKMQVVGTYTGASGGVYLKIYGTGTNTTCGNASQMPICVSGTFTGNSDSGGVGGTWIASTAATAIPALDYSTGKLMFTGCSCSTTFTFLSGTFTVGDINVSGNNGTSVFDFSTNNPTVNLSNYLNVDGTGTFNAGSGTWTITGTDQNAPIFKGGSITFNANTSTFVINSTHTSLTQPIAAVSYYNLTLGGAETYDLSGTTTVSNNLNISNASAVLDTVSGQNYGLTVGGNFSNSGTFTPRSGTLTFNDNTKTTIVSGSNTFNNLTVATAGKNVDFTAGTTTVINGLLSVTGTNGNNVIFDSTSASVWTINHQGTESITYLTVNWGACDGASTAITMGTGSTKDGNSGSCWQEPFAGITVGGTVYSGQGTGALASKTVVIKVNGADGCSGLCTAETNGSGVYSIANVAANVGDVMTIFLDDETENGVHVRVSAGTNISTLDIYQNTLIISYGTGSSITNTHLDNYDDTNGGSDGDVLFGVTSSNLSLNTGAKLLVWTGMTFAPGGTVTTAGDVEIQASAILNMAANALSIGGDFVNAGTFSAPASATVTIGNDFINNGTFTHNSGTLVIAPTVGDAVTIGGSSDTTFYNLTNTTPKTTMAFANGRTYSIAGTWTVTGASGQVINIQSDSSGVQWLVDVNGSAAISYANVKDSGCSSSADISATTKVFNQGNNGSCWKFRIIGSLGNSSGGGAGSGGSGGGGGGQGGGSSSQASATATLQSGAVNTVNIVSGGSGYAIAPAVCFEGGSFAERATAIASIVNGVVNVINIIFGGSGYQTIPSVLIAAPPGDGGSACSGGGGGAGGGGGGGSP